MEQHGLLTIHHVDNLFDPRFDITSQFKVSSDHLHRTVPTLVLLSAMSDESLRKTVRVSLLEQLQIVPLTWSTEGRKQQQMVSPSIHDTLTVYSWHLIAGRE